MNAMKCVKCGLTSVAATAPNAACPGCGAIYAKAMATGHRPVGAGRALAFGDAPAAPATPGRAATLRALMWAAGGAVALIGLMHWVAGKPVSTGAAAQRYELLQLQAANDQARQYLIAKRSGPAMDACAQAGFTAAAYLAARNEAEYARWRQIEADDCAAAGVRR